MIFNFITSLYSMFMFPLKGVHMLIVNKLYCIVYVIFNELYAQTRTIYRVGEVGSISIDVIKLFLLDLLIGLFDEHDLFTIMSHITME